MDRLVNLLNEYDESQPATMAWWEIRDNKLYNRYFYDFDEEDLKNMICSKDYGFIKWLSENKETYFIGCDYWKHHFEWNNYEDIIMLLSVIDKPLEFLSSLYH